MFLSNKSPSNWLRFYSPVLIETQTLIVISQKQTGKMNQNTEPISFSTAEKNYSQSHRLLQIIQEKVKKKIKKTIS